jgi:DNA polymerase-3 subunit beta
LEQLNIEGKRSGDGFVAHKAMLVNALSRTLAERLMLLDFTIGRKGFLGYLKALAGSNVVKVVPASVDASGTQVNGHKKLKVVCGANTSYLNDLAWVGDKTPLTLADVRVSPNNSIKPNIGSLELSEALTRVLPFTAKDDNRPVLQCVNFVAKGGKLTMVSADGFRLAVVTLDYDGEGQALVSRDDLRGIANALRKAKRVRLGFEASGDTLDGMSLIIDTEAIRYKWRGVDGNFPDYGKLIPTEFNTIAHLDTVEAVKAIASLKVLADSKSYPIDLTIGNGKVVMANTEDKGQAELTADTEGDVKVRIDGGYLAQALKACGGMVDFKLTNSYSPTLFTTDGYQLVVMPMATNEANEQAKRDREQAKAEAVTPTEPQAEAEPSGEAETEPIADEPSEPDQQADKPKRKRKAKEPVAVA